jgi:hypothetical protein
MEFRRRFRVRIETMGFSNGIAFPDAAREISFVVSTGSLRVEGSENEFLNTNSFANSQRKDTLFKDKASHCK